MTAEICSRARACRLSSPLSNRSFRDGSSSDWLNSSRHSSFTPWNHRGGEFHSGKQCNPVLNLLDAPSHASVIVCVWLHMCGYASAYMCVYGCVYICVCTVDLYLFIYVYVCLYLFLCASICVVIFVHICIYVVVLIFVYVYVCVFRLCVYGCVYVCMCEQSCCPCHSLPGKLWPSFHVFRHVYNIALSDRIHSLSSCTLAIYCSTDLVLQFILILRALFSL